MDFKDSIKQISDRIEQLKANLLTEEATKNALILPFLASLGYDVFNPMEVLPEMNCDRAAKKGEKIDYAIMKDGNPIILIECKHWQQDLKLHDNQLLRYFSISKAKFGILTNGIIYKFYTDLIEPNVMDRKPFLEVNMLDLREAQIEELKKFHKSYFSVDNILSSASELKYMSELKALLTTEFNAPSPEFVKYLGKRVYDGVFTPKVLEQFTSLTKRAINSYINDIFTDRLNAAINDNNELAEQELKATTGEPNAPQSAASSESKIVTTEEEMEAFYIVKSILRNTLASERITHRDALSYFAIFADDNNRKPICRLYLDSKTHKKIAILDENKKEMLYNITCIDDIYNYSQELEKAALKYK